MIRSCLFALPNITYRAYLKYFLEVCVTLNPPFYNPSPIISSLTIPQPRYSSCTPDLKEDLCTQFLCCFKKYIIKHFRKILMYLKNSLRSILFLTEL